MDTVAAVQSSVNRASRDCKMTTDVCNAPRQKRKIHAHEEEPFRPRSPFAELSDSHNSGSDSRRDVCH